MQHFREKRNVLTVECATYCASSHSVKTYHLATTVAISQQNTSEQSANKMWVHISGPVGKWDQVYY